MQKEITLALAAAQSASSKVGEGGSGVDGNVKLISVKKNKQKNTLTGCCLRPRHGKTNACLGFVDRVVTQKWTDFG
jgi:hypothetical protein